MLRRRYRTTRGFTLVELATIVVIVGILAVVSVVFYRKYVRASHLAEATDMTKSIRAAQEAYKAERGIYSDVSRTATDYYPAATPGAFKTQWGGPCTGCNDPNGWRGLTVEASGPVMFGYSTTAGIGAAAAGRVAVGSSAPPGARAMAAMEPPPAPPSVGAAEPFYATVAWGDPDGDGNPTVVYGFSQSGQLIIQGD